MIAGLLLVATLALGPGKQIDTARDAESKLWRIVPAVDIVTPRLDAEPQAMILRWSGDQPRLIRTATDESTSDHSKGKAKAKAKAKGHHKRDDSGDTSSDTEDDTGRTEPVDSVQVVAESSVCAQQTEYFPDDFARVLEDFDRTETLRLDGPDWDNTLIRNCRIHDTAGSGIFIRDVRNVVITGCEVFNTGDNGIKLSSSGSTANVTLDGNHIHDVGGNGVSAAQRSAIGIDHQNLRILNNVIHNTGYTSTDGSDHSLYIQSQDFRIEGNVISGMRDGNGISVRSSGVIRCNTVSGASSDSKPAIRYYSDHQSSLSNLLLIERNQLTSDTIGVDIYPTRDRYDGQPPPDHVVKDFVIRYNSITAPEAIRIAPEYETSPYSLTIYDNQ